MFLIDVTLGLALMAAVSFCHPERSRGMGKR